MSKSKHEIFLIFRSNLKWILRFLAWYQCGCLLLHPRWVIWTRAFIGGAKKLSTDLCHPPSIRLWVDFNFHTSKSYNRKNGSTKFPKNGLTVCTVKAPKQCAIKWKLNRSQIIFPWGQGEPAPTHLPSPSWAKPFNDGKTLCIFS